LDLAKNFDFGHLHYRKKTANNACNPSMIAWLERGVERGDLRRQDVAALEETILSFTNVDGCWK
jgi:hypothetical protein